MHFTIDYYFPEAKANIIVFFTNTTNSLQALFRWPLNWSCLSLWIHMIELGFYQQTAVSNGRNFYCATFCPIDPHQIYQDQNQYRSEMNSDHLRKESGSETRSASQDLIQPRSVRIRSKLDHQTESD